MARIAESELERLKAEVSVVRLVEECGIKLAKRGTIWWGHARSIRTIRPRWW
jgi:hypothetical protein